MKTFREWQEKRIDEYGAAVAGVNNFRAPTMYTQRPSGVVRTGLDRIAGAEGDDESQLMNLTRNRKLSVFWRMMTSMGIEPKLMRRLVVRMVNAYDKWWQSKQSSQTADAEATN